MLWITRPIIGCDAGSMESTNRRSTSGRFANPKNGLQRWNAYFGELRRVLKPGGYIAFEVGEVRRGKLKMEELVIPAAKAANLNPVLVLINTSGVHKDLELLGRDESNRRNEY